VVRSLKHPIKVLGDGELTTKLTVHAHAFSKKAAELIEAAGGSVVRLGAEPEQPEAPKRRSKPAAEADLEQQPEAAAEAEPEPESEPADEPEPPEEPADEPVAEATDSGDDPADNPE
jgi:hypothetical protein